MTLKVWTNVPLNLTLQHSSHTENKWQMHLCAAQIILHAHLMVGRLCNIPYVSYSLNELRKQKQNNASTEYRLFKHNSVIMYAKQTLLICFFFSFLQEIHKMMPAHTLPQNGCYFASASMWWKAIYILHTQIDNHTVCNKVQLYSNKFRLNVMTSDNYYIT